MIANQAPITPPGTRDVIDQSTDLASARINCIQVGVIKAFNAATGPNATIELVLKRQVWNNPAAGLGVAPGQATQPATEAPPTVIDYPLLFSVPVLVFSGGGGSLTMPIAPGDFCVVLFNDRDLDPWLTNGTYPAVPNSTRVHSLADGIAIVGLKPASAPFQGYSSTNAELKNGIGKVSIALDGTIQIIGKGGASAAGSTIQLDTLVKIANATYSFKTLLDNLIAVLLAFQDTAGYLPNAATIANLNALKLQFDALFET